MQPLPLFLPQADEAIRNAPEAVTRLIFCSGQFYYDLVAERAKASTVVVVPVYRTAVPEYRSRGTQFLGTTNYFIYFQEPFPNSAGSEASR